MRAILAPHVDEEVVAGQWFRPAHTMEDDGLRAFRFLRRRLSSGEHIADRIRGWNVLVLTPTRLLVFTARTVRATPPVVAKKLIGSWPLSEVSVKHKGRKVTSHFHGSGNSWAYSSRVRRATLEFAGDERPLVIDFPDDPLAKELLNGAADRSGTG